MREVAPREDFVNKCEQFINDPRGGCFQEFVGDVIVPWCLPVGQGTDEVDKVATSDFSLDAIGCFWDCARRILFLAIRVRGEVSRGVCWFAPMAMLAEKALCA